MTFKLSDYPEHDKLEPLQPLSQAIGTFLEWLQEAGYTICERHGATEWMPIRQNTEQLLAEHFEIDLKRLEAEKRAMIGEVREQG